MSRSLITLILICSSHFVSSQQADRYIFYQDDLAGFINSKGQIVIKPQFKAAMEFSESLSAVRINGRYGYIDTAGTLVIPAKYDYAKSFSGGIATVFLKGIPIFIDRNGRHPFEAAFKSASAFRHGLSLIQTNSGKYGMINKKGELVIDTSFGKIQRFDDGLFVVIGIGHREYDSGGKPKKHECGIMDSTGKFLVPFGKYSAIEDYNEGLFRATIPPLPDDTIDGYSTQTEFIDKYGKVLFTRHGSKGSWINNKASNGMVQVQLYKTWLPEENGVSYSSNNSYIGYLNLKGELIINDTTIDYGEDFYDNRAFVRGEDPGFSMINKRGNYIVKNAYRQVAGNRFFNGHALVRTTEGWGLIDTNANLIAATRFENIDESGLDKGYFFFTQKEINEDEKAIWGVADIQGRVLIKPVMEEYHTEGFQNGLLICIIKGNLCYINMKGEIVWEDKSIRSELTEMNIDFLNRGYFYASQSEIMINTGHGYGRAANQPRSSPGAGGLTGDALEVRVIPSMIDTFSGVYKGMTVYLTNNSKSVQEFNAQDSRLYMKVQAQDEEGNWKDIEYLPSSWCGNSYHKLSLKPNSYWKFVTPVYAGEIKTKMRIALTYLDPASKPEKKKPGRKNKKKKKISILDLEEGWMSERNRPELTIYSNEYDGSVNPGQFWRKEEYYSRGIMDPYND